MKKYKYLVFSQPIDTPDAECANFKLEGQFYKKRPAKELCESVEREHDKVTIVVKCSKLLTLINNKLQ